MSEIAVRVVHPGGERTAQLLDDRAPARELVAVLVVRLALPDGPNYRLVDESSGRWSVPRRPWARSA